MYGGAAAGGWAGGGAGDPGAADGGCGGPEAVDKAFWLDMKNMGERA